MKSLVVDDDVTSRKVLEGVLSGFGPVDCCGDGQCAVRAAATALQAAEPYDLISMDLQMPLMSGLEAIQMIRRQEELSGRPHAARIVVITSSQENGDVNEAFRQLADAYIVKPINREGFLDVVDYLCPAGALNR